jgi:beta-1,4-mannosyltransferase
MTTHDRVADGRPPARVLAWPAFRKQAANPYGALLAAAIRKQGVVIDDWTPLRALVRRVDLWHVHHPDTVVYPRNTLHSALGTAVFAVLLYLAHWRGIRILWTVHDLDSNDGLHPWLEAWLWRYFLPRVDAFTCLTEGSLQLARERFPQLRGVPGYTITHGHYRDAYPNEMSQEQAREALGLPPQAKVLLYFGLIRPYKNVPHLIDTFRQLKDPDLILLVVGKLYDAKEEQAVRERADGCPRVRLELRWIPPEQVQKYFAASDLVVLPYRRVLNSGAAMLALTFARPVLVPDLGNMREQQEKLGVQWIMLYEGELTESALAEASRCADATQAPPPNLTGLGWAERAEQTIRVYEEMLSADAGSHRDTIAAHDAAHAGASLNVRPEHRSHR